MRTALPVPHLFTASARRDKSIRDTYRSAVPYNVIVGRQPGLVTVDQARRDPNAFVEYIAQARTDVGAGAHWWRFLGRQNRVAAAPVGAGMARPLSTWKRLFIERVLARGERVALLDFEET